LVSKLTALERPVMLVPDELHELSSPEALAEVKWLLERLPLRCA